VKPATIVAWFRQLAARKYDSSEARRGRPPKPNDVRKLVVEMAMANPGWGYAKIRDAMRTGLAIEIGRTTGRCRLRQYLLVCILVEFRCGLNTSIRRPRALYIAAESE
jgi:hypothetical protein